MKRILQFILILVFANPVTGFPQDKNEELIPWSNARRLNWADYKGDPVTGTDAAAATTSYLGIEYTFSDNTVGFKIVCKFSKNKSWVLHKTDHILGHEQGHFDITEVYARKLNKETGEYKFNKNTYQKDLQKIYNDIVAEKEKIQNQYDHETDYSRNKGKQAEWLIKIADMLDQYEAFGDYN